MDKDKSVRFWDRFAERYAKKPIGDSDTYQKKVALTQAYLTPQSDVLEFGCGTGSTALLHALNVKQLLAIDSSPKMVAICKRKLADSDLKNVEFRHATLFDLDADDSSFDAVLGLNVLHLIDDYRASIRKAYELLKPGGVFVSSTVCMSSQWNPMKPVLALGAALGLVPRVQFISAEQLEADMITCGFTLIEKLEPQKSSRALFVIARKPKE